MYQFLLDLPLKQDKKSLNKTLFSEQVDLQTNLLETHESQSHCCRLKNKEIRAKKQTKLVQNDKLPDHLKDYRSVVP